MADHHTEVGLGLEMDTSSHLSDLTNLAGSPRNASSKVQQSANAGQHLHDVFSQQSHMHIVHDGSYNTGPQGTCFKQASSGLEAFAGVHLESENNQSTLMHDQCQQQQPQVALQPHSVGFQSENAASSGLAEAFGFSAGSNGPEAQTARPNSAVHESYDPLMHCSDSQATLEASSASEAAKRSAQFPGDHASPTVPEISPVSERHHFKSYPTSPHPQSDLHSPEGAARLSGDRQAQSHRPSHSLGQAAAFMSSLPARGMFANHHASAPVSPSDGLGASSFPTFFQYPGPRQDQSLSMTDHGPVLAQGGTNSVWRPHPNFAASSAPSVRSTSPSNSLASTSMTSISPLGSTRINPDGSFTSQECSFDSLSNAASGSFSRASSASEDVFSYDFGSLGVPPSLRMSKQKKKLRNIDRKMICDYSAANPQVKQDAIAHQFGIERSTVSKILKQKDKWLAIQPGSDAARIAKHRAVKFPAVEDRLTAWVAELEARGEAIRDTTIRNEALRIARELGLGEDKFKASGGWIEKFRERNQIPKPQSIDTKSELSNVAGPTREPTPAAGSGGSSLTLKSESSEDALTASMTSAASASASMGACPPSARRQAARGSRSKSTPQKRAREEDASTRATLGMSPLSNDMARMHFSGGVPPGPLCNPAFFSPDLYVAHPSMPPPSQNYAFLHGGASVQSLAMDCDVESDCKRRRAVEKFQATQSTMALGPGANFQFSPVAAESASSSHDQTSALFSQSLEQPVTPPQKSSSRGGRNAAKTSAGSRGGRSRRGKGRLSNVNHTPQTPSPLSMSPADPSGESGSRELTAADAEQITAATLERIRALQNSGDASSLVTAEQAQQSLELVLRFLREQPSDFLPPNHFVVFGHLQANIEQKIRDRSTDVSLAEGTSSHMPSPLLQAAELNDESRADGSEEQREDVLPPIDEQTC